MRPADVLSYRVLLPPSLANYFWSGWRYFESLQVWEKMVRAWVQHHTVFKRSHKSTMIHWQTWDFQHSDQRNILFHYSSSSLFSFGSHGSQSKTLKVGALPMYWSTFTLSYSSPIQLPEMPDKIHSSLQSKPQALHGHWPSIHARHDTACPCSNSLLTLRF